MKKVFVVTFLLVTYCANAQFITPAPVRNGSISANEYGTNNSWYDGFRTWYMAWDATNLYIAVNDNGNAFDDELFIYIDTDPSVPVVAGTGVNDGIGNFDGVNYGRLPFSANFCAVVKNGFHRHKTNTGINWSADTDNSGSIQKTTLGNTQEIQIAWSLMGGRPLAFNFFMYLNGGIAYGGTSNNSTSNDNDQSGNVLNLTGRRYFTVSNTNNGSSTPPFSRLSYTNSRAGSITINNYGNTFYDVTLNIGATSFINAALNIDGNLWINDNDALNMNGNAINLKGDITRRQPIGAISNMGLFTFNGTTNQTQNGNITYSGGLTVNKPSGNIILASNGSNAGIIIPNAATLTLTSGIIDSRTNNTLVEVQSGGIIAGGNASSYINGRLQRNNIGSTEMAFPVGNSTYNPAYLANSSTIGGAGTPDNFTIIVGDYLTADGSATGSQATVSVVNRTWDVTEGTAGGSNATLKLQWSTLNPNDELPNFLRSSCYIGHYYNNGWQADYASAALQVGSTNYYTQERDTIKSFSPFGIASIFALPLQLSNFTAQKQEGGNKINWQTTSEENNKGYYIQNSIDGILFTNLDYISASQSRNNNTYHYSFVDRNTYSTKVYYRLALKEYNDHLIYSKIISLDYKKESVVVLTNNSLNNQFTLQTSLNKKAVVKISTISGQTIQNIILQKGIHNTNIDLSNNGKGIYYIIIQEDGEKTITKKVVVQ